MLTNEVRSSFGTQRSPSPAAAVTFRKSRSYEVIHLGGQAAVVVPVADFLRLQALEQAATPTELEDAEDTAAVLEWKAQDAASRLID